MCGDEKIFSDLDSSSGVSSLCPRRDTDYANDPPLLFVAGIMWNLWLCGRCRVGLRKIMKKPAESGALIAQSKRYYTTQGRLLGPKVVCGPHARELT